MTLNEKIDAIRDLTAKLHALLQDPEPGLVHWNIATGNLLTEIAKFAPAPEATGITPHNICGDVKKGDLIVQCECGLYRAQQHPHGHTT